jgi:hypothetical protein
MTNPIPVKIEKVMELEGAIGPDFKYPPSVYAHISYPVNKDGAEVRYALLAIFPQHGIMHLGEINPRTKSFDHYDRHLHTPALYQRACNHVVNEVYVPVEQLKKLKTIDDVLSIPWIKVKRELFPE